MPARLTLAGARKRRAALPDREAGRGV